MSGRVRWSGLVGSVFVIGLLATTMARGAVLKVGTGTVLFPCDHATVQSAIAAANSGDEIRLAASAFDVTGGLQVFGKDLTFRGGFAGCSPVPIDDPPTVFEALAATPRLLEVFDAEVLLQGVHLVGNLGRVVDIDTATVALDDVEVTGGLSGNGGGVRVSDSTLTLSGGTRVWGNQAGSSVGGGIYCQESTLRLHGPLRFDQNEALFGGGLAGENCAVELLGEGGAAGEILFEDNVALDYGGAIDLAGTSGSLQFVDGAAVRLGLVGNTARFGGAISSIGTGVYRFRRVRSAFNSASESGGLLWLSQATVTFEPGIAAAPGTAGIHRVFSSNSSGVDGPSVFRVGEGGSLWVENALIVSNGEVTRGDGSPGEAESVATVSGDGSDFTCVNCAWAGNFTSALSSEALALVRLEGATSVLLASNTVVDNSGFDALFAATTGDGGGTALASDLLEQDNSLAALFFGALPIAEVHCGVIDPGTPVPGSGVVSVSQQDAQLVPTYPFRMLEGSPAIDACNVGLGSSEDIEGRSRPLGAGWEPGVWEFDPPLFADGFESGGSSSWSSTTP